VQPAVPRADTWRAGGSGRWPVTVTAATDMVVGMATQKVTVTLPEEQGAPIRRLVDSGRGQSVSGFVQHAVSVALDDVAGWGAMLAEALAQTGGDLTADE